MLRFRLSARLILFSTTIVILATAVLSSVVYLNFKEEIHQQILENLTGAAEHKALDFKSVLEFEKTNLLAWRSSSVMVDVVVDDLDKRIYQELSNLKKQYKSVAGSRILGDNPFYEVARIVAAGHHENYDGSGYPKGLKGDEIPLAAQIVKITDVFDALTTQRLYKKA